MLFGNKIKELRDEQGLLQRQLAAVLEIDTPMFSKIERGDRRAKREQVIKLAELLHQDENEMLTLWLADKVLDVVKMSIFFGGEQNGSLVQRFRFFLFTEKRLEGHVFRTFAQLDDRYGNQLASFFHEDRAITIFFHFIRQTF